MEYEYLHEVEVVVLESDAKRPCTPLWKLLKEQGFTLHEDVFSLDRPKKPPIPIWQTRTIVAVHIYSDDTESYDVDDDWNRLELKYLLATQPRDGIALFVKHAADLAETLNIPMKFRGGVVSRQVLEKQLNSFADEVTSEIAEPGSEDLAIVIESTYPRNRS